MARAARRMTLLGVALAALPVLAGCKIQSGTDQNQLVVDFETTSSAAAYAVVVHQCGSLPGVSVINYPSDPSVHFDVDHASNSEYANLTECLAGLESDKTLQIRGVRPEDGEDS